MGGTTNISYTYDLDGNLTNRNLVSLPLVNVTTVYNYDVHNRLVSAVESSATVFTASYDFRTRRLSKTGGGPALYFRYDGGDSFQEYLTNGTLSVEFVRGSGLGGGIGSILYDYRGTNEEYFSFNAVGHTVALTGPTGAAIETDLYEAFGKVATTTGSSSNNRLANTKERDYSLRLDNHGFRYYDFITGRYITRDPLGYRDGMNVYTYVHNNPINFYDPLGLGYWEDVGSTFEGEGMAAVELVVGTVHVVTHPIQAAQGVGQAVVHPIRTGQSIVKSTVDTWNSGAEGQGKIVGNILIAVGTAGAGAAGTGAEVVDTVAAAGRVAQVAEDAAQVAEKVAVQAERTVLKEAGGESVKDAATSGPPSSRLQPHPDAQGAHTSFKVDPQTGKVTKYETYQPQTNPQNPNPWESVKRVDTQHGEPHSHFNKATQTDVPTPHVHEPTTPGKVRPAKPDELPDQL